MMSSIMQMLFKRFRRGVETKPHDSPEQPVVFAVANCHPTRVVLYAAAFQGGWKVEFMRTLREAVEAARRRKPKAVFYDHAMNGKAWDQCCSELAGVGIPFILLGHRSCDETFLILLAAGGYHASGDPLTSEDVVKAVSLAEEVRGLANHEVPRHSPTH
jgi:DNA-binding NtrC family response regulator